MHNNNGKPNARHPGFSVRALLRAALLWVIIFELLAHWRGWHGVSWLGGRIGAGALLPALLAAVAADRRAPRVAALALAAPAGLAAQIVASSLRRRDLNPIERLRPGAHTDRSIERINIPMAEGYLPALYIVPHGGARAAVCILHGSGCDKTYYAWRLADALVSRGMAALFVDLDGHGESPRLQRFPETLGVPVAGAGWLRERHARVGLIGISLGGCLAARAVADGLAVDALAILESPPELRFGIADQRAEARALLQPFVIDILGESSLYYQALQVLDLIKAQRTPRIRATVSTWELISRCELCDSLGRIDAPLLLVYGGRDAIVKPAQAEEARQAAPPHAEYILVPEASHLTLILHPGALATVGGWMGERLKVES
jgi:pimeloyl-ACP methyl ester carboxylesterase